MTEPTNTRTDKFLVQTRSQVRSSGMKLPEVHGAEKGLVLHLKPEHQKLAAPVTCPTISSTSFKAHKSNKVNRP